jgi:Mn-dependent DtxR family transcriptional regulator
MPRGTIWTDEMKATAAGMKRAGFSNKAIAARLGVSPKAVQGCTQRLGAKRTLDYRRTGATLKWGRLLVINATTIHDELGD